MTWADVRQVAEFRRQLSGLTEDARGTRRESLEIQLQVADRLGGSEHPDARRFRDTVPGPPVSARRYQDAPCPPLRQQVVQLDGIGGVVEHHDPALTGAREPGQQADGALLGIGSLKSELTRRLRVCTSAQPSGNSR